MPIHAPENDPADFAARLKEAMTDAGQSTGHGAGAMLSSRYGASNVTANAWLNGEYMPTPERALDMADDYGVEFNWLYFGRSPKRTLRAAHDRVAEDAPSYGSTPSTRDLTPRELILVNNYRAADESTKNVVDAAAAAGAKQPPGRPAKKRA